MSARLTEVPDPELRALASSVEGEAAVAQLSIEMAISKYGLSLEAATRIYGQQDSVPVAKA